MSDGVSLVAVHLWAAIIVFSILMYAALDGFDLGVGMLLSVERDRHLRERMLRSISTVWDGNETWLILVGVALFGGFPRAYARLLESLYLPVIVLLLALIVRGIVFEFHAAGRNKRLCETVIGVGSFVSAFVEGSLVGILWSGGAGLVDGEPNRAGGLTAIVEPLPMLTGAAAVLLALVLGAGWLRIKVPEAERGSRALVLRQGMTAAAGIVLLAIACLVPVASALPIGAARAAGWIAAALGALGLLALVHQRWSDPAASPFRITLAVLAVLVAGGVVGQYPAILPPDLDLRGAASPANAQLFLLVGCGVAIPVILLYTTYGYHVFRGPVADADDGDVRATLLNPKPRTGSVPDRAATGAVRPAPEPPPAPPTRAPMPAMGRLVAALVLAAVFFTVARSFGAVPGLAALLALEAAVLWVLFRAVGRS